LHEKVAQKQTHNLAKASDSSQLTAFVCLVCSIPDNQPSTNIINHYYGVVFVSFDDDDDEAV
jgi:hypothetical protein